LPSRSPFESEFLQNPGENGVQSNQSLVAIERKPAFDVRPNIPKIPHTQEQKNTMSSTKPNLSSDEAQRIKLLIQQNSPRHRISNPAKSLVHAPSQEIPPHTHFVFPTILQISSINPPASHNPLTDSRHDPDEQHLHDVLRVVQSAKIHPTSLPSRNHRNILNFPSKAFRSLIST
jgi:hypothetical protein